MNAISISITEAKKEQSQSYWSSSYWTYKIVTKSNLPQYRTAEKGGHHEVFRRFSDFEYLLNTLKDMPEYSAYVFPPLAEKSYLSS